MKQKSTALQRIIFFVGSSKFFWGVVVFVALEAIWIALTGRYPMAFDEDFHLGVIRLYADHGQPFWSAQPADGNAFGALARDPSYLFHYLMSFPYRFMSIFTDNQTVHVLFLRAINIGFFLSCLPLYRRLLLKTGASRSIVHLCFAVFVLVPIVPFLAAQINYDNVILPITALLLLGAVGVDESLRRKQLDARLLILVVCLGLFGSLIKYAFLPIVVAVFMFLLVRLWQHFTKVSRFTAAFKKSVLSLSRHSQLVLGMLLLVLVGLCIERYGINLIKYHTPVPDCGQVLTVSECSAYGPWIRDHNFSLTKSNAGAHDPVTYTGEWLYGMWFRSFFAVDGPATVFQTRGPLPVPGLAAIVLAGLVAVAVLARGLRVARQYNTAVIWLFVGVTVTYVATLWFDEYKLFLHTGQPVAINGRYLLPVLLPVLSISALCIYELIGRNRKLGVVLAGIALVCLLYGGGAATYILRSNDAWYWRAQPVYNLNHAVQHVLSPVTPGYDQPTMFLR